MLTSQDIQTVKLAPADLIRAAHLASVRQVTNIVDNRKADCKPTEDLSRQYIYAGAQLAVCKWLDVFWPGETGPLILQKLGRIEVRLGDSIVLDGASDDPALPYVLVTSPEPGEYRLVGWIYGREGMISEFAQIDTAIYTLSPKKAGQARMLFRPMGTLTETLQIPVVKS